MVAAVTHLTPHQIQWDLPLAQGLQYQAIWLELQGNTTEPAGGGFDSAAKWRDIAGL